jgi:hypothetical protein
VTELLRDYPGSATDQVVHHGLRPPLAGLNAKAQELLKGCFGAETRPEMRFLFSDIVRMIEKEPTGYFAQADMKRFAEYKRYLDNELVEPMDEHLRYLLGKLTDMISIGGELATLPEGSPFLDKILFCLGRMFGDEDVVLIARYQIASKRCLDGAEFVQELDAIQTFPPGRPHFPLGNFIIDPDQPIGSNRRRTFVAIPGQGALFQALRNILAAICCEHPCVLNLHGWNIVKHEGNWSVLVETGEADPLWIPDFERWSALDQSKFLLSTAIAVLELHCRGVLHGKLDDMESFQVKDGRAQLCNFGLLDAGASFETDAVAAQQLFSLASEESSRLAREEADDGGDAIPWTPSSTFPSYIEYVLVQENIRSPGDERPLREFAREIASEATPKGFPFDLFFHLVHCPGLWARRKGPLDVPDALVQLTRGLDDPGHDRFTAAVRDHLAARGFLPPGFFK